MLRFVCASLACVQQYLGIGYSPIQSDSGLIWSDYRHQYHCTQQPIVEAGRPATFYQCLPLNGQSADRVTDPFGP